MKYNNILSIILIILVLSGCNLKQIGPLLENDVPVKLHLLYQEKRCNDHHNHCLREFSTINVEKYSDKIFEKLAINLKVKNRTDNDSLFPNKPDRILLKNDIKNIHQCFKDAINSDSGRKQLTGLNRWDGENILPATDVFGYIFSDQSKYESYGDHLGHVIEPRNGFVTFLSSEHDYAKHIGNEDKPNHERLILHELGHSFNLSESHAMNYNCKRNCENYEDKNSIMNQFGQIGLNSDLCMDYSSTSRQFLDEVAVSNLPTFHNNFEPKVSEKFCKDLPRIGNKNYTDIDVKYEAERSFYTYYVDKDVYEKFEQVLVNVELTLTDELSKKLIHQNIYNLTKARKIETHVHITQKNSGVSHKFVVRPNIYEMEGQTIKFKLPVSTYENKSLVNNVSSSSRIWSIIIEGAQYDIAVDSITIDGTNIKPRNNHEDVNIVLSVGFIENPLNPYATKLAFLVDGIRYREFNKSEAEEIISILRDDKLVSNLLRKHYFKYIAQALKTYPNIICLLHPDDARKIMNQEFEYANEILEELI